MVKFVLAYILLYAEVNGNNIDLCCTLPSKSPTIQQFYFKPVTTNAVQKCISKMHGNKFFGVDKIPFKIYKDCLDRISFSLTDIFNKYSQKCISPEKMALKTSLGIDYIDQSCAFTDQSFSTSYGLSTSFHQILFVCQ